MKGTTLKRRAFVFALCAGGIALFLSLLVTANGNIGPASFARALIPAIVCAAMCWASAQRSIAATAEAIDIAVARLESAAQGDLVGPIPPEIGIAVPQLAKAMESLFRQLGANLDSVQRLAMFDPVTTLPNRTNFRRGSERLLSTMAPETVAALLFIDLDRFKAVNDTMGHAMGDMLLGMVANRLRAVADRVVSETGAAVPIVGRLAGDEFTMLFPSIADPRDAAWIGRCILFALGEPFDLGGSEVAIGASIGIAVRPDHGTTLHDLMRAADIAMYHAKAGGRGRAEYFSEGLAAQIAGRAQLESELRTAIDRDQFALVFQPQHRLIGEKVAVAEALLRWHHPDDGLRMPSTFIERAEQSGLIVEIGDWVVTRVAQTIARWAKLGIDQRLAVNLSPRQIDHADFFGRLGIAMRAAGAPARLLELEITETLAMHCSEAVIAAIAHLRTDGATITIDEFGTGYSNIARLRALPIDRIKIDRSLIAPIADHAESRLIAQAVIGLIHGLGCEAVATGIETAAQSSVLRILGCDVVQGFAIAEPMDEASFLSWSNAGRRVAAIR